MTERKVYGYLVFKQWEDDTEIHRMAVHTPEDSRQTERVMNGVDTQMDHERLYYEWEDAS